MEKEGVINLRESFHRGAVRGQFVAHLHERANDKHAHLHGARAVEDVRGLERTVFREGMGTELAMLARPFFKIAICDVKARCSSTVSWNIKSVGNRFLLRLTASLKRNVGTA
jgi:hypothetical protein